MTKFTIHTSLMSNSITTKMKLLRLMDTVTQNLVQKILRDKEDLVYSIAQIFSLRLTPKLLLVKKHSFRMSITDQDLSVNDHEG